MTCPCVYPHDDTERNTIHIHSRVRNTVSLDPCLVHMSGSIAKFCDSTSIMNRILVSLLDDGVTVRTLSTPVAHPSLTRTVVVAPCFYMYVILCIAGWIIGRK